MDHLPVPQNPVGVGLQIPYICDRYYRGGPFLGYPERHSVSIDVLIDKPLSQQAHDERERFIQEWIFFGLLHEMYGEFSISDEDFIVTGEEGIRILNTNRLNDLARRWIHQYPPRERRVHAEHMGMCLDRAWFTTYHILREEAGDFNGLEPEHVWSLYAVMLHVEAVLNFETGLSLSFCKELPVRKVDIYALPRLSSICFTEITRIKETMHLSGLYYVSFLSGQISHQNDSETCGEVRCSMESVAQGSYKTRHDLQCDGECAVVCVDQDQLCDVLQRGRIPGVSISELPGGDGIELSVVECTEGVPYIAVSHVWSDGMGNEASNALPECQIKRLYRLLRYFETDNSVPIVLWMDTLCCPVSKERGRNAAISFMQRTYQNSSATLVLDASLESVNISGLDDLEILVRIAICPWKRRLWTLQEANLPNKVYFQFKDGIYDPQQGVVRAGNAAERWRIPILANVLSYSWMQIRGMRDHEFPRDYEMDPLAIFAATLNYRTTSFAGDEPVCLATLLGFGESNIRNILSVPRDAVEERMKRFWLAYAHPPAHIVFNSCQKLKLKGFRWAPKTFLNRRSRLRVYWTGTRAVSEAEHNPNTTRSLPPSTTVTKSGLQIRRSGFLLKVPPIRSLLPSDDAPSNLKEIDLSIDPRFLFRDQQGGWFVVQIFYSEGSSLRFHSPTTETQLALTLKDMPGEARVNPVGTSLEPSIESGLAAISLICDNRPKGLLGFVYRLAERILGVSILQTILHTIFRLPSTHVLPIGEAYVSRVDPSQSETLDFIYEFRDFDKRDIAVIRETDSRERGYLFDQTHFRTLLLMFHNIEGTLVSNHLWCFT